ncbi:hypothetical protein QTP70_023752, partial [Hemibagrus guttatus]
MILGRSSVKKKPPIFHLITPGIAPLIFSPMLPKNCIYQLSLPESQAMEEYNEESLTTGGLTPGGLVVINRFSKVCELIPLKGLPTAMETSTALFDHVFRNFGLSKDIVSDRGPQFTSQWTNGPGEVSRPGSKHMYAFKKRTCSDLSSTFDPPPPLDMDGSPAYQ